VTNAARHAGARHVDLTLVRDGEWLELSVEDDGRGVTPNRGGHGITGMRERLDALGGSLDIEAGERGVRVRARVPRTRAA
jgi:signal transduction histidine kinase